MADEVDVHLLISHQQFEPTFQNWLTQQHIDLDEMVQTLAHNPSPDNLIQLVQRSIDHFQEYLDKRSEWAVHDAPSICSPLWGTTFEKSCFWIGGCRPSLAIRFVYSLCGCQLKEHFEELLQGQTHGNLGELSATQLKLIDALHLETIEREKHLSSRMATLQEGIVDKAMLKLAEGLGETKERQESVEQPLVKFPEGTGETSERREGVEQVLDGYAIGLANLMRDADKLRLITLKEITTEILTPLQAVELLVNLRKLHLSIREWGKRRDQNMGLI